MNEKKKQSIKNYLNQLNDDIDILADLVRRAQEYESKSDTSSVSIADKSNDNNKKNLDFVDTEKYDASKIRIVDTVEELKQLLMENKIQSLDTPDLSVLTSSVPMAEKFNYGNTKAENTFLKQPLPMLLELSEQGGATIDVAKRGSSEEIVVNMMIGTDKNIVLPEGYEYSLSQATLLASIGSNFNRIREEQKNKFSGSGIVVTLEQLAGFRDGVPEVKLNEDTKQELLRDIETLSSMRIEIKSDAHREYNERSKKKSQNIQADYKGNMLYTEILTENEQTYIHIMRIPVLYEYAIDAGQVIKHHRHSLDLKHVYVLDDNGVVIDTIKTDIKAMNPQRRCIRDYVLREIGMMRSMRLKKKNLTYELLYEALSKDKSFEGDLTKKSTRSSVNKNVTLVLDTLKEKDVIKSWDYQGQGRTRYYSFYIVIDPSKKD